MFIFSFSANQKLVLAQQQMALEYDNLKQKEAENSLKLQEFMSVKSLALNNLSNLNFDSNYSTNGVNLLNSLIPKQNNTTLNLPTCNDISFDKLYKDMTNGATKSLLSKIDLIPTNNTKRSSLLSFISVNFPTFQLHLIVSLTILLLTHNCHQYLIVF